MQANDVIILNKNIRYLDPIWESLHAGPSWWMEDDGILQPYKTHKEKSNEMISQETMKRVAAYISLMMQ